MMPFSGPIACISARFRLVWQGALRSAFCIEPSCMQQARRRKKALERQAADRPSCVASGPMRRGLRIAGLHSGQCPGAVSTGTL